MAVSSGRHLPAAAHGAQNGVDARGLQLDTLRACFTDGLLMLLGPEGDPIPPKLFLEASAAWKDAFLPLEGGGALPVERVAAVLIAQSRAPVVRTVEGEAWQKAMLGQGPSFAPAPAELLLEERHQLASIPGLAVRLRAASGVVVVLRNAHPGACRLIELSCLVLAGRPQPIENLALPARDQALAWPCDLLPADNGVDGRIGLHLRFQVMPVEDPVWPGEPKIVLSLADGAAVTVGQLRSRLIEAAREASQDQDPSEPFS